MFHRGPAALALLLTAFAWPALGQGVPLAWKLNKGDEFYLRTVCTTRQTLKSVGREVKQDTEQTTVLGFKVKEKAPDGGLVVEQTIERLSVKSGGGEPVVDDRLAGVALTLTLSPKMELLRIEGYDRFLDKLAGDDAAVRKTLQNLVSEETLKRSVRETLAFLPDRPVREGESWQRLIDAPFGALGSLRIETTYKLEGKEDVGGKKVEKIGFTQAVEFKVGKADPAVPYHVVSGDLKADEARGTLHFDAAGRLVQSKSKLVLRGRMVFAVAGANVETEVQQEQTTDVTLLKDNPVKR